MSQANTLEAKGQAFVETATNAAIMEVLGCNAGRASNVRKEVCLKNGWTSTTTRQAKSDKPNDKATMVTMVTTLSFSQDFKDAMQHLQIVGYMPFIAGYTTAETVDGNAVTVNPQTRAWLAKELFAEPLNATFMFATRNCKENDWKLAGLETPAMRQARIDAEKLAQDKLESALKLVQANGYKLVKPESYTLFANWQASEGYRLAEYCTMASLQALDDLLIAEAEAARFACIQAYLAKRAKIKFEASQTVQASATASIIADDAALRIEQATKERDEALAREKALEERLARLEALLTATPTQAQVKPSKRNNTASASLNA